MFTVQCWGSDGGKWGIIEYGLTVLHTRIDSDSVKVGVFKRECEADDMAGILKGRGWPRVRVVKIKS